MAIEVRRGVLDVEPDGYWSVFAEAPNPDGEATPVIVLPDTDEAIQDLARAIASETFRRLMAMKWTGAPPWDEALLPALTAALRPTEDNDE